MTLPFVAQKALNGRCPVNSTKKMIAAAGLAAAIAVGAGVASAQSDPLVPISGSQISYWAVSEREACLVATRNPSPAGLRSFEAGSCSCTSRPRPGGSGRMKEYQCRASFNGMVRQSKHDGLMRDIEQSNGARRDGWGTSSR